MPFGGYSAVVNEIKTDAVGRFSGKRTGGRSDSVLSDSGETLVLC